MSSNTTTTTTTDGSTTAAASGSGIYNSLPVTKLSRFAVLDTHYACVRYLYHEIFRRYQSQINDLQSQTLFLKCITKYLLCRSGQYAHLYNLYSNLDRDQIRDYYDLNRRRINITQYEWLNYTNIIPAPRILPVTNDGPYILDNMALHTYTYFWTNEYKFTSNILATPFYCLDGINHLYVEMLKWKSDCEKLNINLNIQEKHIFHDIFYVISIQGTSPQNSNWKMRFLIWVDDIDIQTELYVTTMNDTNNNNDDPDNDMTSSNNEDTIGINTTTTTATTTTTTKTVTSTSENGNKNVIQSSVALAPISLLKRLYIACDNNLFIAQLSDINADLPILRILNMFINRLSRNFIVTFDGKPPKRTKSFVVNITNVSSMTSAGGTTTATASPSNILYFDGISKFGLQNSKNDQIYEIENLSELNITNINTKNCLIFQQQIYCSRQPSLREMNNYFQEFLYFLSLGIIDVNVYVRMYMLPFQVSEKFPVAMNKQLSVIYMQKFIKFGISRESIDYSISFYDKTYVFSAKNLVCTIKSLKYLVRNIIKSPPLLPASVLLMFNLKMNEIKLYRLTQNIIYIQQLHTLCFLNNFTIQQLVLSQLEARAQDEDDVQSDIDRPINNEVNIKNMIISTHTKILQELQKIFYYNNIATLNNKSVCKFENVDLKCIIFDSNLHLELYYFAWNVCCENTIITKGITFRDFFHRFMNSPETKRRLNDNIYTIFLHLFNLYTNNIIL